jgi:radical SAM protein with 4Fe4S-binding SPASM domain
MVTKVDSAFHQIKETKQEDTPEYKEYRRRWYENPKTHTVGEFPIHLDLEGTPSCNLKCVFCYQSFDPLEKGFMEMDLFKKCIDEGVEKGLCSIKLQYRGETLLHPKVVEMVQYAKDKGVLEVMFNTNGMLLTEELSRKLINAGIDKIIFSIEGTDAETYEKLRIGAKWETVLNNIKALKRVKEELGSEKPITRAQMVATPELKDKVDEYAEFWSQYVDNIGIDEYLDYRQDMSTPTISKEFACPQFWQRLIVFWDGTIIPCCEERHGKLAVGNAKTESISDVWKGPKMQKLREKHLSGESHTIPSCATCISRKHIIDNHINKKESS